MEYQNVDDQREKVDDFYKFLWIPCSCKLCCLSVLEHGMTFHNFSECSMKSGRQKQTLFGHKLTESCQSITELFLSDPFPPRDILAVYTNSNLTSTVLLYLFLIESLISNVQKQRRSS